MHRFESPGRVVPEFLAILEEDFVPLAEVHHSFAYRSPISWPVARGNCNPSFLVGFMYDDDKSLGWCESPVR